MPPHAMSKSLAAANDVAYLVQVLLQTTAVATGTMPLAAGLVGVIPALSRLTLEHDGSEPLNLSALQIVGWSLAVAFFGYAIGSLDG